MDLVLSRANGKDFLGAGQHFVCNHLCVDLERAIANRCAPSLTRLASNSLDVRPAAPVPGPSQTR